MSTRHWIALSLAGAFTLVVLALVATRLTSPDAAAAPPEPPGDVEALRQREEELIRRIDRANRRLEEQDRALDEARRQLATPPRIAPARARAHGEDHEEDEREERHESYASRWEHEHDDD